MNSPHTGLRKFCKNFAHFAGAVNNSVVHTYTGGLDLASLLIKEVANHLKQTFSSIHTFSTLSPMPKFMSWLQDKSKVFFPARHKEIMYLNMNTGEISYCHSFAT